MDATKSIIQMREAIIESLGLPNQLPFILKVTDLTPEALREHPENIEVDGTRVSNDAAVTAAFRDAREHNRLP